MSGQGIRAQFAKAYAQKGIAKLALIEVLGKERADKMNPHTLRARANARTWATLAEISEKNV